MQMCLRGVCTDLRMIYGNVQACSHVNYIDILTQIGFNEIVDWSIIMTVADPCLIPCRRYCYTLIIAFFDLVFISRRLARQFRDATETMQRLNHGWMNSLTLWFYYGSCK